MEKKKEEKRILSPRSIDSQLAKLENIEKKVQEARPKIASPHKPPLRALSSARVPTSLRGSSNLLLYFRSSDSRHDLRTSTALENLTARY